MLCLQTGKTLKDANRMRFDTDQLYVKSTDEMVASFSELPDAVLHTCQIAEQCNVQLDFKQTFLPDYQVPDGQTYETYLQQLAKEGLTARIQEHPTAIPLETYQQRLETELQVLFSMGYAGYFLIVWDIINFARSRGIPVGPGRGSAAGSLVAYALRITDLDPLRYHLLFERFLNPERVTMPDIDMDFCMDRRGEVINYVIEKYGEEHVCQIITFGTLGAKAAIRDVGRVMDIPYAEVYRVAKLVPPQLNITLKDALIQESRLQELVETDSQIGELMKTAQALEGLARHASTHAAGVVISQKPLMEHVPLYKTGHGEIVTQYSMTDLEKVGLVKFDFLGLKTLTMIDHAITMVNANHDGKARVDSNHLPRNDQETFTLLSSGKTTGIFQLESSGMRNLLVKIQPEIFDDLIAILALYRPGPLESGMVDDFITRKQDPSKIVYDPPGLKPILQETYGVIVYQEQVMAIAHQLAGFSLGQADLLRRAMGKKKPEEMTKHRTHFLAGAQTNHLSEKTAGKIFDQMAFFAGYGFNKSHSAAYALITYQTAFLKTHYPMEFMAALLTSEMGNTDKMVGYFSECREMGLAILPPDINQSHKNFTVVSEGIRFGLAAIKNVGEGAVDTILSARSTDGPFASFYDFCCRMDLHKVNKRVFDGLIKVGAFDSMKVARSQLMAIQEKALEGATAIQRQRQQGQTSLFDVLPETAESNKTIDAGIPVPDIPEWSRDQLMKQERELTGFYITAHPLERHAIAMQRFATGTTASLPDCPEGKAIKLCGVIATVKSLTTKKGNRMAYLQLEDLQGTTEIIVFPDLFQSCSQFLHSERIIQVTGTVDHLDNGARLKASNIELLTDLQTTQIHQISLKVRETEVTVSHLCELQKVFQRYPGPATISFQLYLPSHVYAETSGHHDYQVTPTSEFLDEIEKIIGKSAITLQ